MRGVTKALVSSILVGLVVGIATLFALKDAKRRATLSHVVIDGTCHETKGDTWGNWDKHIRLRDGRTLTLTSDH